MLFLILAYGHFGRFLDKDVHGHQGGVGEQAGIDPFVALGAYDLMFDFIVLRSFGSTFDAESLAGLVLERGCAHEFSDAYVHVQKYIHL